jgi:cytidylate kinase
MGAGGGVIMEGRDIGTKVFPDADVKIFLDAAPEVRGDRRFRQKKQATPPAAVVKELRARDRRDRTRAASPLVAAPDAVLIDSTSMGIEQVIEAAEKVIGDRQKEKTATD